MNIPLRFFPHIAVIGMAQIDLAAVNIDPSSGSFAVANNLRIAALTVAAYEYVSRLCVDDAPF